jgi:hypothetical protein
MRERKPRGRFRQVRGKPLLDQRHQTAGTRDIGVVAAAATTRRRPSLQQMVPYRGNALTSTALIVFAILIAVFKFGTCERVRLPCIGSYLTCPC